ncbi:hypothetical protein RI662_21235, partial [Brevibacillus agri]|uniref:hypothetical protein n=1 Tax=Brevibacillus agri TaxID=51101 RepID=UPI0028708AF3
LSLDEIQDNHLNYMPKIGILSQSTMVITSLLTLIELKMGKPIIWYVLTMMMFRLPKVIT